MVHVCVTQCIYIIYTGYIKSLKTVEYFINYAFKNNVSNKSFRFSKDLFTDAMSLILDGVVRTRLS